MKRLAVILTLLAGQAFGHEFWIEPLSYRVPQDAILQGRLVNGQEFAGVNIPYLPQRFVMFQQFAGGQDAPVGGRLGDSPGLQTPPLGPGLQVISYVSSVQRVDYETFDKFLSFAEHKDFADMAARHMARQLPLTDFAESYIRHAKTLIAVGDGAGADLRTGMETEIVALANPYTDDTSAGLPVQVWYQGAERAGAQVELFEKADDGTVQITLHRTNDRGIATLPVKPGHSYLVDAVVLREPAPEVAADLSVVWETLWASLTFRIPGEDEG